MAKRRVDKERKRTAILTLRLTNAEMLRFRVAALTLCKKRGRIVRERIGDLISASPQATVVTATEAVAPGNTVVEQPAVETK
jgi:hypothetical protein